MNKHVWVKRTDEWIKNNPGKGTVYKHYPKEGDPPPESASYKHKAKYKQVMSNKNGECGIYVIICESLKSVYVGQSINMDVRIRNHKWVLSSNNKAPASYKQMREDLKIVGIDGFKFIKYLIVDESELIEKEQEVMWEYQENGYKLYNTATPIGINTLYCPPHLRDLVNKIILLDKNDNSFIVKLKQIIISH